MKIKLNLKNFNEFLSRDQLKQITGGDGSDRWCQCGSDEESCVIVPFPDNHKSCAQLCDELGDLCG